MNTILTPALTRDALETAAPRIISIDVFRGFTMAVMIFVNALAEVRGLPWWTYHAPAHIDVMTYVDMVFPFFLFAVGMSLPLSIAQRLKHNSSLPALWLHVANRALALVVLGLILANGENADPIRMGISGNLWALLCLICAAIYLNVYEKSRQSQKYSRVLRVLRILGLIGLVILLAIFRRTTADGQAAWLDTSYPEILGLIGYSYLAAAILYIPARRWGWAPSVWFVLLVSLCTFSTAGTITFQTRLPIYLWPFNNGAMACIVMAGVITSSIFLRTGRPFTPRKAIALGAGFCLLTLAAGRVLTPLGISKIRATPTWSLYSIAAAVFIFTLIYWVCDVHQWQRWALLVRPAGANTLLTYLLPDLWDFSLGAMGITWFYTHFALGWTAVAKTLAFTLFMLAAAAALTKAKVRLRL